MVAEVSCAWATGLHAPWVGRASWEIVMIEPEMTVEEGACATSGLVGVGVSVSAPAVPTPNNADATTARPHSAMATAPRERPDIGAPDSC